MLANDSTARAEQLAREREAEDAAKAPLFFRASQRQGVAASAPSATAASPSTKPSGVLGAPNAPTGAANSGSGQNSQSAKSDFLTRGSDSAVLSSHALQLPVSPYQVMAGTVIPAALITGINSDLPGHPRDCYRAGLRHKARQVSVDSQGTRLIGEYDSQVAFGQRRVLLVWNRLIFPDASSLTLDRLPGVDAAGNAGLEDGVDRHWRQLLGGASCRR